MGCPAALQRVHKPVNWKPGRGCWHTVNTPTELIEQRLAAVGPASRTALELLALCAPVPLADLDETAPLEVLASLEAAGLITVVQDGRRTRVSLAHPLYGEVLRAKVPALRSRSVLLRQTQRTLARGRRRADDALRMAVWQLTATGRADAALLREGAATALRAYDYCQALPLLTTDCRAPGDADADARCSGAWSHCCGVRCRDPEIAPPGATWPGGTLTCVFSESSLKLPWSPWG